MVLKEMIRKRDMTPSLTSPALGRERRRNDQPRVETDRAASASSAMITHAQKFSHGFS